MKQILVCFGTRPEYIKVKSLIDNLPNIKTCFTGQHEQLLENVKVDYKLDMAENISDNRLNNIICCIMKHSHIFANIDYVLVQGDTTSAVAMALSAFNNGIKVIHLEAGLRSNNLKDPYPEEANRQLISRIADIHLCPTDFNKENLLRENVSGEIYVTGNTGLDNISKESCEYRDQVLITMHRRDNHEIMEQWFQTMELIANKYDNIEFLIPLHPNPNVQKHKHLFQKIKVVEPMSHEAIIEYVKKCKFVISDSGGLQEECSYLNKKIIVCRKTTERPESVGVHSFMCENPEKLETLVEHINDSYEVNTSCPYGNGESWKNIQNIINQPKINIENIVCSNTISHTISDTKKMSIILLAGGNSTRFNYIQNKTEILINGKSSIEIVIKTIKQCDFIDEVILVTSPSRFNSYNGLIDNIVYAENGKSRLESLKNGFKKTHNNIICIHDVARPLVSVDDLQAIYINTIKYQCCGMVNKLTNNVVKIDNDFMISKVEREQNVETVTPQGITYPYLNNIFNNITLAELENESELLNLCIKYNNSNPYLVFGNKNLAKLTYIEDYSFIKVMDRLYDKTVLMTGVTGEIGFNILKNLLKFKLRFVFIIRDLNKFNNLIKTIPNFKNYECIICDINTQNDILEIKNKIKTTKIDYIILSHGIVKFSNLKSISTNDITEVINVNYLNVIILLRELFELFNNMLVINISSSSILKSRKDQQIYSSSKSAFHNFINGLKFEYPSSFFYNIVPSRCNTQSRSKNINDDNSLYIDLNDLAENIINIFLTYNNSTNGNDIFIYPHST